MNSAVCMLEETALRYENYIAVQDESGCLNYSEYRTLSRKIGTSLIRLAGTGNAGAVIVYLPKSIRALTCFMGAMYSGNPYAPVDMHIPMTRLQKIVDSLHPAYIITDETLVSNLSGVELGDTRVCMYDELTSGDTDDLLIESVLSQVADIDPIYIMYTSGSTGTPKGVTIPHRGIIDYADWLISTFHFDTETVMANQAPFYFDNSTFDIYGSIRCGGKLILTPESLFMFPSKLPQFIQENHVTSIFWVPTVMINVANSGALSECALPELKNVSFCGEVMPNTQLNIWRKALPDCAYANLYGPTEVTDVCCYYKVDREFADSDPLPIGKACKNMRVLVLTEYNEPAKPDEQGELCILGSGVANGYWNEPELTAKAFVQNPLNKNYDERMYRTGDLAYWNKEGLLMFLGRRDSQIKIKGNRVELGEIETAAMCVECVQNACAVFDTEKQEIVLFVETSGTLSLRKFNMELKKYIPQYMLPGRLVPLEALPHTANDKIDRVTLKASLR
jgi:D-alanine--poly(phosphoribitol) ligase subunit 1